MTLHCILRERFGVTVELGLELGLGLDLGLGKELFSGLRLEYNTCTVRRRCLNRYSKCEYTYCNE